MTYIGTQTADPSCEETVIVTKSEYDRLIERMRYANALDDGGVDNWEWYSESLNDAGYFDEDE